MTSRWQRRKGWYIRICVLFCVLTMRLVYNHYEVTKVGFGQDIELAGEVVRSYHNDTNCIVKSHAWMGETAGKCQVKTGNKVRVIGRTVPNVIMNLSGKNYLRIAEIEIDYQTEVGSDIWRSVRETLVRRFLAGLPHREAVLASGVVVGDESMMGYEQKEDYKLSGVMHIVVVSGFNLYFIFGPLFGLLIWWLPRPMAMMATLSILLSYVLLTGAGLPVIRAYLMLVFVGLGVVWGRRSVGWWSLMVSVILMLIWDFEVIVNPSFLLSVGASVGLIIASALDGKVDIKSDTLRGLYSVSGIMTTVMCTLMTAPILWWYFGRVAWIGIVTNSLIGFVVPGVTGLGFLYLLIPDLVALPLFVLLKYIHMIVDLVLYVV
jgi:ComEC/Rec2-related protein